ncbi:MAG TPA: hypothetical protein ENJ87_08885, partial [Gammaproteobacteria bacterium]|nr:hypothetical protein [Gammaproteobacteria bacterium]
MTSFSGLLLLGMILSAIAHMIIPQVPPWLAGTLAWLAMFVLLPALVMLQRIQAMTLISIGLLCMYWGWSRGIDTDIMALISKNDSLLALLAGVSYLRLVTLPSDDESQILPTGRAAFLPTLIGTHLFSSVINLSALLIVTERLQQKQQLNRVTVVPLMRAFSAAAFWSPFFAAMGVALTYAPGASLTTLVLQGIPLVFVALAYTAREFYRCSDEEIKQYQGYPVHFSALWVPALLVFCVLVVHQFKPDFSVILIVAGLSLLITVLISMLRDPEDATRALRRHTLEQLPKMSGELALFLSAGVLAVGLSTLFQSFDALSPNLEFSFQLAVMLLLLIVVLAVVGIHPVISIATLGVWIAPLHPDPDVLGTIFLSGWAIGVVAAPLSGL